MKNGLFPLYGQRGCSWSKKKGLRGRSVVWRCAALLPWKPAPARKLAMKLRAGAEATEELLFRRKDVTGGPDERRVVTLDA